MTITTPDAYNSDVTFVQNGTGLIYPNYNGNSNYAGNLTVTSPAATAITFGAGSGTATFSGSGGQAINATGVTAVPVFTRLVIANTGSGVTLNSTPINVSGQSSVDLGSAEYQHDLYFVHVERFHDRGRHCAVDQLCQRTYALYQIDRRDHHPEFPDRHRGRLPACGAYG